MSESDARDMEHRLDNIEWFADINTILRSYGIRDKDVFDCSEELWNVTKEKFKG